MIKNMFYVFVFLMFSFVSAAGADQPVMNEAPRWAGGWGFQVRNLTRESDTLISNDSEVDNPLGLRRRKNTTMLEGVYTWDRSRRITIKIPYVDHSRITNQGGVAVKQSDRGLGDVIVAVPLRKYTNFRDWSQNFSLTPNLRVPTGKTSGDYPIGDGSTDVGLSFSYSAESSTFFSSFDLHYWINNAGTRGQKEGNQLGFDMTLGYNFYHDGNKSSGASIQFDFGASYKDEGFTIAGSTPGTRIMVGPAFTYFRGPTYIRAVYSIPVYEYALDTSISYGHEFDVGIGWSFNGQKRSC